MMGKGGRHADIAMRRREGRATLRAYVGAANGSAATVPKVPISGLEGDEMTEPITVYKGHEVWITDSGLFVFTHDGVRVTKPSLAAAKKTIDKLEQKPVGRPVKLLEGITSSYPRLLRTFTAVAMAKGYTTDSEGRKYLGAKVIPYDAALEAEARRLNEAARVLEEEWRAKFGGIKPLSASEIHDLIYGGE